MPQTLPAVDVAVLVTYLVAIVGVGLWCGRRRPTSDEFMAAGRSLPGWAVGLSMFGSYVSSISFLGNPGAAFKDNWNPLVFSLATPLAAWIAVRWFMPFYRRSGHVSAYEHLEERFGPWARTYAVACFLLTQVARTAAVVFLLALAVAPLTGWSLTTTIAATGGVMTVYTLAGGIEAVVWTGVVQSVVLIAGTLLCLGTALDRTPGGVAAVVEVGRAAGKFSLGSFGGSLSEPTFWVLLLFGLATHLGNFGADQSYVQRYVSARSDRDAARSIRMTAWMYLPTAAIFFFIGTTLFVLSQADPSLGYGQLKPDEVFPRFIATQLPVGAGGLVVAAIFAASMDSNLNSMATLTLRDLYQRRFRPQAAERESLLVLRASTVGWGVVSTAAAWALTLVDRETTLSVWWKLAGLFSGGVLGLFLLGLCVPRAGAVAGVVGTALGVAALVWMALPQFEPLLAVPPAIRSPLHANLTLVVATAVIFFAGAGVAWMGRSSRARSERRG